MLPLLIVGGILAGMPMTVPLLAFQAQRVMIAHPRDATRPSRSPSCRGHCRSSPAIGRRRAAARSRKMITETQTRIIVLQLTDELAEQLQPFMAELDITATAHKVEPSTQRLTMRSEVYEALAERVGGTLDYDVRWQPNEYEPDGFVERVCPLELTNGMLTPAGCPQCGAQILANRAEITCACGQVVALI